MIKRAQHLKALQSLLKQFPVVAILGPRQVGKTTLARQAGPRAMHYDLEDPAVQKRLEGGAFELREKKGLVVLDEVQRQPELFQVLRVLADRRPMPARFLVLGSASPQLLRQGSESLAGRIAYYPLPGLGLKEVGAAAQNKLWLRGGYPDSYLARNDAASWAWRQHYVRNFLERDIPTLGSRVPAATLGRFWSMLAHWHGQVWNGSELARAFGVSEHSVRNYLDLLAATYVVRILQPWHENLSKRQVRSPKVYLADSGLLHSLLDLRDFEALRSHPKVGASWEGFAMAQVIQALGADERECYFWATQQGAELDLLVVRGKERLGFEFKANPSPALTPSMRIAFKDLRLQRLEVIHPGKDRYSLAEGIVARPLSA